MSKSDINEFAIIFDNPSILFTFCDIFRLPLVETFEPKTLSLVARTPIRNNAS